MKALFLLAFLFTSIFADFYIVSGDKKVKMTSLETGKIDFSTFKSIAHIERGNDKLHAFGKEIAFNHRHLNFRLATIGLIQTNYTITEFSEKAKNSSDNPLLDIPNDSFSPNSFVRVFGKPDSHKGRRMAVSLVFDQVEKAKIKAKNIVDSIIDN